MQESRSSRTVTSAAAPLVLLGLAALVPAAAAQTMYRCGNIYQDRACDHGQPSKVVNIDVPTAMTSSTGTAIPTGTAAAAGAGASAAATAECARKADAAQRIVWVRETGQTEEQQIAKAEAAGEDTTLIRTVYRRGGSAMQIRASIEAECLTDAMRVARSNPADAARTSQCNDMATSLDTLRQTERGGMSSEHLRQQIRDIQARMRSANC